MILERNMVEIRTGKVDKKSSDKLVMPGTLVTAQNAVMNTTGRLERRAGTSLLTTQSNVRTIHDHGGETLLATSDTLYSRYASANNSKGGILDFDTRYDPARGAATGQTGHDMVITNSQYWSVWTDERGGVRYSVKDVTTGSFVVVEGTITSNSAHGAARVFAVGTDVFVTYVDIDQTTPTDLFGVKIAVASPTSVGSPSTIDSEYYAPGPDPTIVGYDGAVVSSSEVVLAYVCDFGGSGADQRVRTRKWNVSTMTSTIELTEASDSNSGLGGIAIIDSSSSYYIAQASGDPLNQIRLLIANSALTLYTTTAVVKNYGATVTVRGITGYVDSGTANILVDRYVTSGGANRPTIERYDRTSGGVATQYTDHYGMMLASSTFTIGGSTRYVLVKAPLPGGVTTTGSLYIRPFITPRLDGRVISQLSAVANVPTFGLLPVPQTTATGVACAADYQVSIAQIGAATVFLEVAAKKKWIEAAGVTVIPGSWPRYYDGATMQQLGFDGPPNRVSATTNSSGVMPNGIYAYKAVWLRVDATGREHRSEPSPAYSHTVSGGANDRRVSFVYDSFATFVSAASGGNIYMLELYRTEVNPSSTSEAAYYLAETAQSSTGSHILTIVDSTTDATLVTRQRLYDLGGTVLTNGPTSPCTAMATWGQRLWSTDRDFLVFSKLMLDETKGVEHNATQFISVADQYGDFVGLVDGGQRLLAFKQGAIYQVTGAGPDNAGSGEFPPVDRLELPLGAKSQLSIVSTEIGVFFQDYATSQIWLLGSNGAEYIGRDIESLMSSLTIVDAFQVGRQVRFYTSQGTTLVYDLHHKHWTWFTGQAAVGAAPVNGVAHYVTSGGAVRYDDSTVWTEAGTTYQMILKWAWLSLAGLAGYMRVYRIAVIWEATGASTQTIRSYYKLGTTTDAKSLSSSSPGANHMYRTEVMTPIGNQRSTSIQIQIEDNSPSTAGFGVDALALEVGLSSKYARVPTANRAT